MLPERQGFREKYRSAARMIFSETACGLTLPSDKKRLPTLPCSSRFANVCVFRPFPFLSVSFPAVTDTKRAARSRTAPLCCNDKFRACSISSDFRSKYSINSLVYWVTYVHNVVYSFYRSMIYCYINSTQRCAGSIVIDIIPTNGADKRKFFPFAPYFPVTNVIKRYFYPYFPAIIGIKGYSFPYFPYLSGIMKIKTALYSLFSRLDWHKTVVFPCLGEIYEGIRSLSWEIPVT